MTIKHIFIILSSFLMLLSCSDSVTKNTSSEKGKKDICLQLYSLRDDIATDYEATIKQVGNITCTSVEAADYDNGKFYGKTPEQFKADLKVVGLTALSAHTALQLTADELKSQDLSEALKWWNKCLDACKATGMQYVVAPWMEVPENLVDLKTYCNYYNEIGKLAKGKGLKFGYHNHDFEFRKIEDEVMYDYMLQNTDPEYVFFQMDVYWVVRGGVSPVDYFHKYPNRFKMLHIKDSKELGQSGMVGFDAILKEENTTKAGVEHLIVEVEHYNHQPIESVRISCDYLQKMKEVKLSYTEE